MAHATVKTWCLRADARDPDNLGCEAIPMSDITVLTIEQACKEIGLSEPTMRRRAADDPAFPARSSYPRAAWAICAVTSKRT